MSFWSAIGGDVKKVFSFISNPKTQAVIQIGEQVAEDEFPASTGLFNILNSWFSEAMTVQGIAEAAAATPGATTNTAKAAAVLSVVTPQVVAFTQQYKLPSVAAEDLNTVNTAVVNILNILTGASKTTTAIPAPVSTQQVPAAATGAVVTGK